LICIYGDEILCVCLYIGQLSAVHEMNLLSAVPKISYFRCLEIRDGCSWCLGSGSKIWVAQEVQSYSYKPVLLRSGLPSDQPSV